MDRSQIITLISYPRTQDTNGVWRDSAPVERTVYCQVDSVTRAEFFEGGRNGLNPEYRFTMFFGDYNGERTVRYNGVLYSIYRTFHARTDEIELYAERRAGAGGANG